MIKAVIFDLDGVLVTTDELHFSAWKQLADELNITGFTRADNASAWSEPHGVVGSCA